MASGDFYPAGDGSEFAPASGEQIGTIVSLTRRLLDGTFSVVGKHRPFQTEHFEGEFFQHWIGQYSQTDDAIPPVSEEQGKEVLKHPDRYFPGLLTYGWDGLAGIDHNGLGMLLGLPAVNGGADYDSLSLDVSLPASRDRLGYHVVPDYLRFASKPTMDPCEAHQPATEEQVRIVSNITGLVAPFCELEPIAFDPEAAETTADQLARQLYTFQEIAQLEDLPRLEPGRESLVKLQAQLQKLLSGQSAVAQFFHRFGNGRRGGSVRMTLGQRDPGDPTAAYEIITGVPSTVDTPEVFVTSLRLDDRGGVDYHEHFDVDVERLIEEKMKDPDFNYTRDYSDAAEEVEEEREASRQAFDEEQEQGFHLFSQADAGRIIGTLEAEVA